MTEFVALKPKTFSYLMVEVTVIKRLKVQRNL